MLQSSTMLTLNLPSLQVSHPIYPRHVYHTCAVIKSWKQSQSQSIAKYSVTQQQIIKIDSEDSHWLSGKLSWLQYCAFLKTQVTRCYGFYLYVPPEASCAHRWGLAVATGSRRSDTRQGINPLMSLQLNAILGGEARLEVGHWGHGLEGLFPSFPPWSFSASHHHARSYFSSATPRCHAALPWAS